MLKKGRDQSEPLREMHEKMIGDIPETCARKFGDQHLDSLEGRAQLFFGLVNKHSGELVELDRSHSGWELHPVAPGSASAAPPGN